MFIHWTVVIKRWTVRVQIVSTMFSWEIILSGFIVILTLKKVNSLSFYLKIYGYHAWVIAISTLLIPVFLLWPKNVVNLRWDNFSVGFSMKLKFKLSELDRFACDQLRKLLGSSLHSKAVNIWRKIKLAFSLRIIKARWTLSVICDNNLEQRV